MSSLLIAELMQRRMVYGPASFFLKIIHLYRPISFLIRKGYARKQKWVEKLMNIA